MCLKKEKSMEDAGVGPLVFVLGTHGGFNVRRDTGVVVTEGYPPPGEYKEITRVDLVEHEIFWGEKCRGQVDILDLCFWTADGEYHHAEEDYREECMLSGGYDYAGALEQYHLRLILNPAKVAAGKYVLLDKSAAGGPLSDQASAAAVAGYTTLLDGVQDAMVELYGGCNVFLEPLEKPVFMVWKGAAYPRLLSIQLKRLSPHVDDDITGVLGVGRQLLEGWGELSR